MKSSSPDSTAQAPGLLRRLASMLYESLLLFGVLAVGFILPHAVLGTTAGAALPHQVAKLHFFVLVAAYFIGFWHKGGQTLALKTWKMRITDCHGQAPTVQQAALRHLFAWPSLLLGGIGIFWSLVDRDRQFLHDRLAGTRIVSV